MGFLSPRDARGRAGRTQGCCGTRRSRPGRPRRPTCRRRRLRGGDQAGGADGRSGGEHQRRRRLSRAGRRTRRHQRQHRQPRGEDQGHADAQPRLALVTTLGHPLPRPPLVRCPCRSRCSCRSRCGCRSCLSRCSRRDRGGRQRGLSQDVVHRWAGRGGDPGGGRGRHRRRRREERRLDHARIRRATARRRIRPVGTAGVLAAAGRRQGQHTLPPAGAGVGTRLGKLLTAGATGRPPAPGGPVARGRHRHLPPAYRPRLRITRTTLSGTR